jgi:hypothetical protein
MEVRERERPAAKEGAGRNGCNEGGENSQRKRERSLIDNHQEVIEDR